MQMSFLTNLSVYSVVWGSRSQTCSCQFSVEILLIYMQYSILQPFSNKMPISLFCQKKIHPIYDLCHMFIYVNIMWWNKQKAFFPEEICKRLDQINNS